MTTIRLAVIEFATPSVLRGDIDERTSMAQVSVELGAEIHRQIQAKHETHTPGYRSEVSVKHTFTCPSPHEAIAVEVSGRIDGQWTDEEGHLVLEEIKTTFNPRRLARLLDENPEHPYLMQLKLYCWMKELSTSAPLKPHLLIVAAGSGKQIMYPIEYSRYELDLWIQNKLVWVAQTWQDVQAFRNTQKQRASQLKFPFAKKRPGQAELAEEVKQACKNKRHFLAQAPTGLGKTAAVIIPALQNANKRGDKLFHVTPKNSQLREVEKLLAKLHSKGQDVKALIVTAKAKICMLDTPNCNPEICRFAKGHYDKVESHSLVARLKENRLTTARDLREVAEEFEVCPYELGRQVMPWVDLVAGDYHYALSPQANFTETSALPLLQNQKANLTIDEAHNLAERSLDWYSARIATLPEVLISEAPKACKKILTQLNQWIAKHGVKNTSKTYIVPALDRKTVLDLVKSWSAEMPAFIEDQTTASTPEGSPLVVAWFEWLSFCTLCEMPDELFFVSMDPTRAELTIHCANAGPLLKETLAQYNAVIAFSATLKPFDYHVQMGGFDPEKTDSKEYMSPFPAKNRCLIAIPQVSTAWKDRSQSIPRIAEVINRVTALHTGNYIAFFPSFELLRQTKPLISAPELELHEQPPSASQMWTKGMLQLLKNKRNILLLAVQGGGLSEGVDLPGESLIGAFIVGPALPMITCEREERRRILGNRYGDGFSLAYIYPAMAKSMQAAGRVVRTPKDRGLIVLMDPRFLNPQYRSSLPKDWLIDGNADHLKSKTILEDISKFWKE